MMRGIGCSHQTRGLPDYKGSIGKFGLQMEIANSPRLHPHTLNLFVVREEEITYEGFHVVFYDHY